MGIASVILLIIVVFWFGSQYGKAERDIKLMRSLGITNPREQKYLMDKFGRGNVSEYRILMHVREKLEGLHDEFDM